VSVSEVQAQVWFVPQTWGAMQPPQVALRGWAQLSLPVRAPQVAPDAAQKAWSLSGVQPQTFAVPPPPQLCPATMHDPQLAVRGAPQLSDAVRDPQFLPWRAQKASSPSAVQFGPHTFGMPPPPQVFGAVQPPQEATVRAWPQLSAPLKLPQLLP